ncbi:hypothetical protein EGH21_22620 [Halomicroarcula sp. F13]|uniref:Uncharacterized protein n=1 Tax=Haloarcula rubra TaxID=2487747 RepID=A0AAW4PYY9_9EURY|nr:hypothetical protein [Halomicroarcula rubra]MBX0325816.1 hypothetical protein [Halomicroarcula rubra]
MPSKQDEASDYDLSSTGTIVETTANHGSDIGWNVKAGTAVDLVVEVKGNDVGWLTHKSVSSTTDENDGATLPEARRVRIRNTTTAADTADALLGVSEE